ncbi:FtsX-like permease family protein [Caulobacter sp. S45]|uniref:FtsX-like permease family protein n=1 Tax=Caulobacter sp. S45 TaxID=1641861 RepID=UPI00131ACB12|nr:FtsX-like permease family protein [Caulobacter sp. S45]
MWSHYLQTLYRSLSRHRLYAALNVFGLAVGITVFLVLSLDVRFETSFERWIPHAEQIYAIQTVWKQPALGANSATMGATLDELRSDYPQLSGTRVWEQRATMRRGADVTPEAVEAVDSSFFDVFDLPLAVGDKSTLLKSPDQILLTQAKAKRYFGSSEPIGQHISIMLSGERHVYHIAGVLKDIPRNTDQSFDFLILLTPQMTKTASWSHWGSEQLGTFVRFARPEEAKALDSDLDAFVDRHSGHDIPPPGPAHSQLTLRTQPLVNLHLLEPKDAGTVVAGLGFVGLLTLLLAAVNYVNLATARAGLRAREVALRKVMGATKLALIGQFMAEAVFTALLAAGLGLVLCELTLPLINAAGGSALKIDYLGGDSVLLLALCAAAVIGIGAGIYPALVLSRFRPAGVLASARAPGGGRTGALVREVLVVVQFTIAIAFCVAAGVIVSQTHYLRTAKLGFPRTGLIVVNSFDSSDVTASQRETLLDAWRALPGVGSIAAGDIAPGAADVGDVESFKRPTMSGQGPGLHKVSTRPGFFQAYGVRLVAGRLLDLAHGPDDTPPPPPGGGNGPKFSAAHNVVMNLNALGPLGFRNPSDAIGKSISEWRDDGASDPLTIVGIVDNVRFGSPRESLPPTIYFMRTQDFRGEIASIRFSSGTPRAVMEQVRSVWRQIVPDAPFRARTAEDNLQFYYKADDQHGRFFTIGAAVALAIGCLGLYGLASFNTARRTKEIGIRKTLGASTADVLKLLIGQFLKPVLLANLIAWPLAWLAMRSWLSGFDQRIALGPQYFLAATALTLLIALATVVGQALRVARTEPARSLRYE